MPKRERQEIVVETMEIITPDDHARELQQHFDGARELLREAYEMVAETAPIAADKIAQAWGNIEAYDNRMEERAAGLIAMLQKMEEQRNEQVSLRQELEMELNDPHGSRHPRITAFVQKMQEYADELAEDMKHAYIEAYHDELVEDAEEYIEESTIDSLADDIAILLELENSYVAHDFINTLSGRDQYVYLSADEKQEFIDVFERATKRMREERKKIRASIFEALEKKENEALSEG